MPDKEVRRLAAVMFTDIEGYSAMVQQDEALALKKVHAHRHFLELYTSQYNGTVIQFYGDGSLTIYNSAVDAVHCAIQMQKSYQAEGSLPVRIGIHVGDIVVKSGSIFGDGVNISSRIQALGIAGSILLSNKVQSEVANHTDIQTKSLGHQKLKNIAKQVEIFAVTNDGLTVPARVKQIPGLKKIIRYMPIILLAGIVFWFIQQQLQGKATEGNFTEESISIPVFSNLTGDESMDHIGQMAAHWISKELSADPDAHVVSHESASEMIKLAGMNFSSQRGREKYASLTGAVNIVEAVYTQTGPTKDTILMSGFFKNLHSGERIETITPLRDVRCSSKDPMECIIAMSGNIKGYWVSRDDHVLTPPNYEAYKAYMAARGSWRTKDNEFVFGQLQKSISLDSTFLDPYFLMLDFFYNEGNHSTAYDTIQSIRMKFPDLNPRQANMLKYHFADVRGKNKEAYDHFMNEYAIDSMDLFTNNSAMAMAMMYMHDPTKALEFFNEIPFDNLHVEGCTYCAERLECAMWAALESGNMKMADLLAPKIKDALYTHRSYGMLIMYYVWKNDTMHIDLLLNNLQHNPQFENNFQYLNYLPGRLFLLRGNKALSLRYAKKAIAAYDLVSPGNVRMLARSYYLAGQLDESLKYYKSIQSGDTLASQRIASEMGMIYARKGDVKEAQHTIEKLESMRTRFDYGATEYYQGRIYTLMGDLEKATSLLKSSLQKGQKFELWVTFTHDPDLLVLKEYQPYKELLESLR